MLLLVAHALALTPHGDVAPCATQAMRAARAAGAERVRPARANATGYDTAHFHLEGSDYTPTDEEYQLLGEIFEEVWAQEIDTMGYLTPYGTDPGLFTVYLEDMQNGLYGYTSVERDGKTAYIAINPDMGWTGRTTEDAWRVTAAHEFFHAIQFEYDYWEASWWMEASSTWMEDEVYDDINDYDYYLEEGQWPDYPEVSMVAENGWHEYGEVIWARYLTTFHGGPDVLKSLWEACVDQEILDATKDALGSQDAFEAALVDFEVRNALGYAGYEEGADWYPVYTWDLGADANDLPATATPTEYYADYLGVNYWRIPLPEADAHDLAIDFTGNPMDDGTKVKWQVTVVGTDGVTWDSVTSTTKDTLALSLPGFGTTWHEGWVLVGILSENTGVSHDAYDSSPRYDKIPPTYSFVASLADPSPEDTGGGDTGEAADTGDTGDDSGRKHDPGDGGGAGDTCGCQAGGASAASGFAVAVAVAALAARRRRGAKS